jgi:uncharacterized membrane protein
MSQSPELRRPFASGTDQEQAHELLERTRDPARVLALSDGVFAIIMTLLVLDIQVPKLVSGQTLTTAFLFDVWPKVAVFVISFVLTGLYWVAHRDMFNLVRGVERGLVWLNILYMLPLALLPAAAALLSAYSRDPLALRIYGLLLVLIALMRLALWYYIGTRRHLLIEHVPPRALWTGASSQLVLILVFIIAILCAVVAPRLSLGIYAGVPLLYFIGITFVRRSAPKGSPERDFT